MLWRTCVTWIIVVTHHLRCQPPLVRVQPPHPLCRPVGLCGHTTRQGDNRDMMQHNNLKLGTHVDRTTTAIMGKGRGREDGLLCPLNGMCFSSSIAFLNTYYSYSIRAFGSLCRSDGMFYWQRAAQTESARFRQETTDFKLVGYSTCVIIYTCMLLGRIYICNQHIVCPI